MGFAAAGDGAADAAKPEDADVLAAQLARQRGWPFRDPIARADIAIIMRHPAIGGEHQRDRQIGGVVGQHVRRVGNRDAPRSGISDVNLVRADRADDDQFKVGKLVDRRCIDAFGASGQNDADAGGGHVMDGIMRVEIIEQPLLRFAHQQED